MKTFLNCKHMVLALVCAGMLYGGVGQREVWAQCECRGDISGPMMPGLPDGLVSVADLADIVAYLIPYSNSTPPYTAPVDQNTECADVADVNAKGIDGGDDQIDIGDLTFLVCYVGNYADSTPYPYVAPCAPNDFQSSCDANIVIWVNGAPWNGVSQVAVDDVIQVTWFENDDGWGGGFSNFNLNVSRGEYLNDFYTPPFIWHLYALTAGPDGQGGINVGGGCSSSPGLQSSVIFTFSFRIPYEAGPAYTIHIRPTQGSWRRVMHDQLPTVDLEVMEKIAQCVDPPTYDLNGDCKIDFYDFAKFSVSWPDTGCNAGNNWCDGADLNQNGDVNFVDLDLLTEEWPHCGLEPDNACCQ